MQISDLSYVEVVQALAREKAVPLLRQQYNKNPSITFARALLNNGEIDDYFNKYAENDINFFNQEDTKLRTRRFFCGAPSALFYCTKQVTDRSAASDFKPAAQESLSILVEQLAQKKDRRLMDLAVKLTTLNYPPIAEERLSEAVARTVDPVNWQNLYNNIFINRDSRARNMLTGALLLSINKKANDRLARRAGADLILGVLKWANVSDAYIADGYDYLIGIGDNRVVPLLVEIIRSDYKAGWAVDALAKTGIDFSDYLEVFQTALWHEYSTTEKRIAAAIVLAKTGDEKAKTYLESLKKRNKPNLRKVNNFIVEQAKPKTRPPVPAWLIRHFTGKNE
ncbi:MAG: hypothetical protein PHH14_07885 [Candidatus Margulisbacteria bacterium]|nr:hypothetical protein [Candidatus Margulisiibacteriota bacterium]